MAAKCESVHPLRCDLIGAKPEPLGALAKRVRISKTGPGEELQMRVGEPSMSEPSPESLASVQQRSGTVRRGSRFDHLEI